jgi:glycosyltransferase involved in cell wall biosynthesis
MTTGPRRIIICVTSDLETDQRVHKTAQTCHDCGLDTLLVGRLTRKSHPMPGRAYRTKRFSLWFEKSALFYANYNIRLFFFLLLQRADLLHANDLDTLPAVWLASQFKRIPIIYDSHEYFLEMPELQGRYGVKKVWSCLESFIFPRLKYIYTVNHSIASLYSAQYHKEVKVIRNLPYLHPPLMEDTPVGEPTLPGASHLLIYQGAGINRDRGVEELLGAMSLLPAEEFFLLVVGSGDLFGELKERASRMNLQDVVLFIDRIPFPDLHRLTCKADLGLTLDKDINLNYHYSLPNKLFDYIHAGIPVLGSDLPEISAIIKQYGVGDCVEKISPEEIAAAILRMFEDPARYLQWKSNTARAAADLCWEKESGVLKDILAKLDPALGKR